MLVFVLSASNVDQFRLRVHKTNAPSNRCLVVCVTRCAYISLVFVYRVKGSSYARGGLVARALITAHPAARGVLKMGGSGGSALTLFRVDRNSTPLEGLFTSGKGRVCSRDNPFRCSTIRRVLSR